MTVSDSVALVATGSAWTRSRIQSVQSAMEDMLDETKSEIVLVTYMISKGGLSFLDKLERCLERGVRVTVIINRFQKQARRVRDRILELTHEYPSLSVLSFNPRREEESLHAKVLVVDNSKALIGSANITWTALVLNHELGVTIVGPSVGKISSLLRELALDPRTVPVS